jgi:hypothetical protein
LNRSEDDYDEESKSVNKRSEKSRKKRDLKEGVMLDEGTLEKTLGEELDVEMS